MSTGVALKDRAPPPIDEGNPPGAFGLLMAEMLPTPGRLRNTLLLLAQVVIAITIGETFRIPMLSILIIISFFLSGNDGASNTSTALMAGMTIVAPLRNFICGRDTPFEALDFGNETADEEYRVFLVSMRLPKSLIRKFLNNTSML